MLYVLITISTISEVYEIVRSKLKMAEIESDLQTVTEEQPSRKKGMDHLSFIT